MTLCNIVFTYSHPTGDGQCYGGFERGGTSKIGQNITKLLEKCCCYQQYSIGEWG